MTEWRSRNRVPLKKGAEIIIKGITIVNDDEPADVLSGSTCLVYHGHIKEDEAGIVSNPVIIKEFYPDTKNKKVLFDIQRDSETGLIVIGEHTKEKEEYKKVYAQFMQGREIQKELASSEAMEIAVKPFLEGPAGDSYYVISNLHRGKDLKQRTPVTLKEKMIVAVCLAETMQVLHEAGYVMLDIKEENFLWIDKPNLLRIVDTDSLIKYKNRSESREKELLFTNYKYISPEIQALEAYMMEGISDREFQRKKKAFIKPISDMYAIGKYLYKLFWDCTFTDRDFRDLDTVLLIEEFVNKYADEEDGSKAKCQKVAQELIEIIGRMVIYDLPERRKKCFKNAGELMDNLNDIYFEFSSKKYVPRKEIKKASATLAAYNILQQYPLFLYSEKREETQELRLAIAGNHEMRKEMLSAAISIGQMLDSNLTIDLVGEDAEKFWEDYISEKNNPALRYAVTWSVDGVVQNDKINVHLVSRKLAHINIETKESERTILKIKEEGCRYFLLLNDKISTNQNWLNLITENDSEEKVFVGCLQRQDEEISFESERENYDFFPVSAECYSEYYSEKMYEAKVFRMGLMTFAYYCGYMDENAVVDMKELEKEFRKDIYNIASSERSGLHSIYKMASIGLYENKPGRVLNYYRKIQNPDCLEKLAWLEHLSWEAYLLTSGAVPESIESFRTYAYRDTNDWKNKSDTNHMGHPLLVSSEIQPEVQLPMGEWEKINSYEKFDQLDKASFLIYKWFVENKMRFQCEIEKIFDNWETKTIFDIKIHKNLKNASLNCIENIGKQTMNQEMIVVEEYRKTLMKAKKYAEKHESAKVYLNQISDIMRPVLDSYKDRDYKQLDRNMVYAVVDMLV